MRRAASALLASLQLPAVTADQAVSASFAITTAAIDRP